jgi:amino acid transporter
MLLSLLGSGLAGFLLLLGVILTVKDVTATQQADNPLLSVLLATFSPGQMALIMGVVAISILACAIASMAAASRLLFSLARDRMLPGSGWLGQIDEGHRTPRHALLLVWLLSTAVVLIFRTTDLISSISAVAGYLGYACIMVAALWEARTAGPRRGRERILPVLALLWTLGLSAALVLPETEIPGWTDRHIPAKATTVAILLGLLLYLFWLRRRLLRGEAGPPLVAAVERPSAP